MIHLVYRLVFVAVLSLSCSARIYAGMIVDTARDPAIGGSIIVGDSSWPFHRFEINSTAQIGSVGGYFQNVSYVGIPAVPRTIFAAVVQLSGPTDFPDSFGLTTPDVIVVTNINIGTITQNYEGLLGISLNPGWYALQFGAGAFGSPSIAQSPSPVEMPDHLTDLAPGQLAVSAIQDSIAPRFVEIALNPRFYVTAVPEPSNIALFATGLAVASTGTRNRRRSMNGLRIT